MSTRDELQQAATWFEEVADFHVIPAIIAKGKLAAAALREKASAVEGFEAWLKGAYEIPITRGQVEIAQAAYAAGHAAASERVAELEAERENFAQAWSDAVEGGKILGAKLYKLESERTLLVAEVRRCWELSKDLYSYFSLLWYRYGGYEHINSIPDENIYSFQDALSNCKKLSEVNNRPVEVKAIVEAQP